MKKSLLVILALTLILGLLLVAPPLPVSADGLVENPGFEDPLGSEWAVSGAAGRVCNGTVHSGSCAGQITGSNGSLTQYLNVTALANYHCEGWIYATSNVVGRIELCYLDANSTAITTSVLSAGNTTGYVFKAVDFRAPIEATQLQICLAEGGWDPGQDVRFDDIGVSLPTAGCFIATAAYGTPSAEEIDVLRAFRDQVLLESALGSQFVAWYYQASPPVAEFISGNSLLRAFVRELVIDPVVSLAEITQGIWGD